MTYSQGFFIEGRFLGTAFREVQTSSGGALPVYSEGFFCLCCGDIYARCPVSFPKALWRFHSGVCCKCASQLSWVTNIVSGSIWRSHFPPEFFRTLPPEVLAWEFQRHLIYGGFL